jgi:hypothetical protein
VKLLVYVPRLGAKKKDAEPRLVARLRAELGDEWSVQVFHHGLTWWKTERMADAANRLSVQIRTWAGDNGAGAPVEEVLLLGHSIGGLLVRHAFLLDAGHAGEAGHQTYPWTAKVRRIVLLAAPNAGWQWSRLPGWERAVLPVLAASRKFTVEELQSGSPYITELRLRWVQAFRSMPSRPTVVQVLGDRDGIVSREDSLDVEYMADATRVDVPGATHGNVVDLPEDRPERYDVLRHAIFDDFPAAALEAQGDSGRPVYFLLHGIRAGRYANWVGGLARQLTAADPKAVVAAPSYGYLSAVEFAIPFTRSRNLRRFLGWYSELYVRHGDEHLHFAGHSNGTYLLGRALDAVPAMRFRRVYLAGSVLPREYPWSTIAARGQIRDVVHSDRATKDLPVGVLCSALRGLGMRDIGTGGFAGFDEVTATLFEHDHAFPGGHGAALTGDERLRQVAAFLRAGTLDTEPLADPSKLLSLASRGAGVFAKPFALGGLAYAVWWVATADTGAERVRRVVELAAGIFVVVLAGRAV